MQVPQQFADDRVQAELKASLASVRVAPIALADGPDPAAVQALPFAFSTGEAFALRSVIAGNTVLLQAAEGPDAMKALLLISKSLAMGDEGHGEERGEVRGADGLLRAGVDWRRQGPGQVRLDVVPVGGQLGFRQDELSVGLLHGPSLVLLSNCHRGASQAPGGARSGRCLRRRIQATGPAALTMARGSDGTRRLLQGSYPGHVNRP